MDWKEYIVAIDECIGNLTILRNRIEEIGENFDGEDALEYRMGLRFVDEPVRKSLETIGYVREKK